jgi:hypothetical protein
MSFSDVPTWAAVEEVVDRNLDEPSSIPRWLQSGRSAGQERIRQWLRSVIEIERVLGAAASTPGRRGRPQRKAALWGATALREIWQFHTKQKPTLSYSRTKGTHGDFFEFCQTVLRPLAHQWGIQSDLERAIRDAHMDGTGDETDLQIIHNVIKDLGLPDA